MHVVGIVSVTYPSTSSRVSNNVWYLSLFLLSCGGGVAILAKNVFNELTFKYIWTNHLSKTIRDVHLWGQKHQTSNNNNNSNNTTITTSNVCIPHLPTIIFV